MHANAAVDHSTVNTNLCLNITQDTLHKSANEFFIYLLSCSLCNVKDKAIVAVCVNSQCV